MTRESLADSRIERRKEFLNKLWRLEKVQRPAFQFVVETQPTASIAERLADDEKALEQQVRDIQARLVFNDDYVPVLIPSVGCNVVVPSAFGCELVYCEQEDPWARPLVKHPRDVYRLKKPDLSTGLPARVVKRSRYFQKKTNGEFPIRLTVNPCPLDTAMLIWGCEPFLLALMEYPKEVHALLDVVTDTIIDFIEVQRKAASDLVPIVSYPDWMPADLGVGLASDLLAVVSPHLYQEFGVPYNDRISDAFGGIFLHSCGNVEPNFKTVLKHKNLRGLTLEAGDNSLETVMDVFSGEILVSIYPGMNVLARFGSSSNYVRAVLQNKKDNTGLYITVEGKNYDPVSGSFKKEDLRDAMELLLRLRKD